MNIIDGQLGAMTVTFLVAVFVQLFLIRRHVNNVADPLVFFALTSAFSIGMASFAVDSVGMYARIVLYYICFYLGFFVATGRGRPAAVPLELTTKPHRFRMIVITSCSIFFCANLIVWMVSGAIVFSDDPSVQKSAAYDGGFGFIRRINWGLGVFALIAATYWWLWERSRAALMWLLVALLTSVTGGGKSALLPMIFALGLYFLNPFRPANRRRRIPSRRVLLGALLVGIVPVAVVLLVEGDSAQAALDALLVRLFFSGDILLYWGQPDLRAHFSQLGPIDYFLDSFGSVLGMLRLVDYSAPIGNQFVQYTLPGGSDFSESLGPNLPFYVRGELYFGPWFAPLHALMIGWILGRIRLLFVFYRGRSLLHYSLASLSICLSGALPIEEGLAVGQATDFLLVFGLVYALISIFRGKSAPAVSQALHAGQKA